MSPAYVDLLASKKPFLTSSDKIEDVIESLTSTVATTTTEGVHSNVRVSQSKAWLPSGVQYALEESASQVHLRTGVGPNNFAMRSGHAVPHRHDKWQFSSMRQAS